MMVIVPQWDSIKHELTSGACECGPSATILSNGEILLVHERVSNQGETKWVLTEEPDSLVVEERVHLERLTPLSKKKKK